MSKAMEETAERLVERHGPGENGADVAQAQVEQKQVALIQAQVRQVLGITIRGLMVSAPGVPAHVLLGAICHETGNLCAGAVSGMLGAVMEARRGMKDAFDAGVKKAPMLQAQPGGPEQQVKG